MEVCCFVIRPWARFATHGTVSVRMAGMLKPNRLSGSFNAPHGEITVRARQRAVVNLADSEGDHSATLTACRVIPRRAAILRWEWP